MNFAAPFSPFFLDAEGRALFCMFYPAQEIQQPKGYILHVPAFAEEMNKSRRMVALQAHAFAEAGYAVLVLDVFGTGDSAGDFSEATWSLWKQDLAAACQWLVGRGAITITLWGLRIGVLLAIDFAVDTEFKINHLLCWQPVLSGELFIMQFLRLRVATTMMDRYAPQEKTADLKQKLLDGQLLEVAGYSLNPDLIRPLLVLSAQYMTTVGIERISVIEVAASSEKPASANTLKFVEAQRSQGKSIVLTTVVGSPFWTSQEIAEVPVLLSASIHCLI